ncbi:MAG: flavodoxin domain-containing protein [Candidatus Bathyarchaeia archaeon]|jgi:menaquinone-dependent protoporphyrinogen oxidase
MKTLLVYGTRYGATTTTSEEIAKILQTEGFDVKIVNAKQEKIRDITPYELIVIGTGLQLGKWTGEIEDFVKRFKNELPQKKVALFISSMKSVLEREGKLEQIEKDRKMEIDDKVAKFGLNPIATGFFGGVLNFNKMNIITRKTFGAIRPQLEKDGFTESPEGVYDLRNWEEIRNWTKEVAQKARQ